MTVNLKRRLGLKKNRRLKDLEGLEVLANTSTSVLKSNGAREY